LIKIWRLGCDLQKMAVIMNRKKIREIFLSLRQHNPHPTTELVYRTHFELLLAVILSAQATDKSVNKATERLFAVANTPGKVLELGTQGLIPYIKTIGLYTTKAKNIIATCKLLIEKFHSEVPKGRMDLESLPGVGRKTANVILNTCFGEPTIAVDTHIFRVANRTKLAIGKNPLEIEKQLTQNIPDEFKQDAHHWLVLLGRYICVARKPHCPKCPISHFCEYKYKTLVE
jgi:endonuclease-3